MNEFHEIQFAALDKFLLDSKNPRLGRVHTGRALPQDELMKLMLGWSLEELAVSFLESGFWAQEAIIVVREDQDEVNSRFVVVEGNRRIATLKHLKRVIEGASASPTWMRYGEESKQNDLLFTRIPYLLAETREDVMSFIGFRHVTGIKQWAPAEKAEFIANMINNQLMTYDAVRRRIGSRVEAVRRNYIAYNILLLIESLDVEVSRQGLENRFSVLFLSLREEGVREFLGIDTSAEPEEAQDPVPEGKMRNLSDFAKWLFGTNKQPALFRDSRDIGSFGKVLSSPQAVEYLRSSEDPSFDIALQNAGLDVEELANQIMAASNQIESALRRVHLHVESEQIKKAVERLARGARVLISQFPDIASDIELKVGGGDDA